MAPNLNFKRLALGSVGFLALVAGVGCGPARAADVTADRLNNADSEPENWLIYNRTYDGQRFSPLSIITRDNVKNLKLGRYA